MTSASPRGKWPGCYAWGGDAERSYWRVLDAAGVLQGDAQVSV
ncbi:hypothetical protein [Myxococcus stipitatus]|nr:hypothetical protein [Myxococcus stipitatus]